MTDRESLAYHEAGHAVAGVLTDYPFSYVTIVANEENEGHTKLSGGLLLVLMMNINNREREVTALARSFAICVHAGNVAEEIFLGHRSDRESWTDIRDIKAIANNRFKRPNVWIKQLRQQTYDMLIDPLVWQDVAIVAAALLEKQTLTAEEVHTLLKRDFKWGTYCQDVDDLLLDSRRRLERLDTGIEE